MCGAQDRVVHGYDVVDSVFPFDVWKRRKQVCRFQVVAVRLQPS